MFYVYEHWRPDRNECFYVGKGKRSRANMMRRRNKFHAAIQNKLARLGLAVEVRIIAHGLTEAEAFDLERTRIALWQSDGADLANMTKGGDGIFGFSHSKETREKMSRSALGVKKSDEAKKNMSLAKRGKSCFPPSLQKAILAKTGRPTPPEVRAKMSEAAKRRDPKCYARMVATRRAKKVEEQ